MNNGFIIHDKLPSLNEYIAECRKHPQKGAAFKREWQERVGYDILLAKTNGKLKAVNKPVVVHFCYREQNYKRDLDNISGFAHKVILDALVEMKILPNDTQKWVKGFTDTFYHSPIFGIRVVLEEREET